MINFDFILIIQVSKFLIFTLFSYILKAQSGHDAEQWIQYLQLSMAIENYRFNLFNSENSEIYNHQGSVTWDKTDK